MAEVERRLIEAELPSVIERLQRCAERTGVVSRRDFVQEANRLGLKTEEQRRRLSLGLASVGIHVKAPRRAGSPRVTVSAPPPVASAGSAAPIAPTVPSEAARRLAQARSMLARYADANGTVSKLAHDGVVRLHGLGPAEARELTASFPITRPGLAAAQALSVLRGEGRSVVPASTPVPGAASSKGPAPKKPVRSAASATDTRLAEAVRAARAVLEADGRRRDLSKVLLTAEEEVGLAVLLRGGPEHLGRDVSAEEIAELPRGGERWAAYECLVRHNLRLVWKIALGYQGRGLEPEDLVQHGSIGLMRAVRKFDAGKGFKLSTYATWWVKQAITRAVADEGTLIRIPVHLHEKVSKVAVAERKLMSEGRARSIDNVAYATGFTFAEVEKVRRISRVTDSLDRIIGDDAALGDLIMGPSRQLGPDVVVIRKEFLERLRHVLDHLPERERHILVRRTGLDGDEPDTLDDIGAVFGVTRERIRQIEPKAKAKFLGELSRHKMLPSCVSAADIAGLGSRRPRSN